MPNNVFNEQQQHFSTNNNGGTRNDNRANREELMSAASADCEQQQEQASATTFSENECNVPVLFTTNRGLYLRLPKTNSNFEEVLTNRQTTQAETENLVDYDIRFCDLKRWSIKRATTINLDDTFTIMLETPLKSTIDQQQYSPEAMYTPTHIKNCWTNMHNT